MAVLVGMFAIVASAIFVAYVFWWGATGIREQHSGKIFRMMAEDYLARNEIDELISHVEERLESFPQDVYAHWYMGQAKYFKGRYPDAKRSFARVVELEPSWRTSADSWLERIEEKLEEDPKLVQ